MDDRGSTDGARLAAPSSIFHLPSSFETPMPLPKAYQQMRRDQPELVKTYEALGEACKKAGPLDERTAALVKLALALGSGLEGASHSAVRKALTAGCTRDELLHVA